MCVHNRSMIFGGRMQKLMSNLLQIINCISFFQAFLPLSPISFTYTSCIALDYMHMLSRRVALLNCLLKQVPPRVCLPCLLYDPSRGHAAGMLWSQHLCSRCRSLTSSISRPTWSRGKCIVIIPMGLFWGNGWELQIYDFHWNRPNHKSVATFFWFFSSKRTLSNA